jgi:hypothetical protein
LKRAAIAAATAAAKGRVIAHDSRIFPSIRHDTLAHQSSI